MKIIFQTTNLNHSLYRRLIKTEAQRQFDDLDSFKKFWRDTKDYQIIIRPSSLASQDPFFYGKNGVGGVTDRSKMILYLEDIHENPRDPIQRVIRTNANVISHEGGHHKLMYMNLGHKVPLRNRDESGTKAGTLLNFWTAEVHDRDIENKMFTTTFWSWSMKDFKAFKYTISFVDFRDLLSTP